MEIRNYTKKELALLYFPDASPHTAVNRLMRWITRCTPLMEALRAAHYRDTERSFTPKQVECIVRFLGEPCFIVL